MGWVVSSEPDFGRAVFSEVLFTPQPSAKACRPYLPQTSPSWPDWQADLAPLWEAGGTADLPVRGGQEFAFI